MDCPDCKDRFKGTLDEFNKHRKQHADENKRLQAEKERIEAEKRAANGIEEESSNRRSLTTNPKTTRSSRCFT